MANGLNAIDLVIRTRKPTQHLADCYMLIYLQSQFLLYILTKVLHVHIMLALLPVTFFFTLTYCYFTSFTCKKCMRGNDKSLYYHCLWMIYFIVRFMTTSFYGLFYLVLYAKVLQFHILLPLHTLYSPFYKFEFHFTMFYFCSLYIVLCLLL